MNDATNNNIPDPHKLTRLFKPGQGVMPPRLAGRDQDRKTLTALLDCLTQDNAPAPRDAVLYGPRGNGKTVLLSAFAKECRQESLDVLRLRPTQIKTEKMLAMHMLNTVSGDGPGVREIGDAPGWAERGKQAVRRIRQPDRGSVSIAGLASAEWSKLSDDDKSVHLVTMLAERCRRKPLVVLLDEAHTLDIEVGRALLNLSETLRTQHAPFLLALAGTPNLEGYINAMNSTFWNRSEIIGISRLTPADTRDALVKPLLDNGVTIEENALASLVEESQCYPYFIQVWGEALCRAMVDNKVFHIDGSVVKAARGRFEQQCTRYYGDRYREFENHDLVTVAEAVAAAYQSQYTLRRSDLSKRLVANGVVDTQEADTALNILSDLGYLWSPTGGSVYEPGIPSLMNHVLLEQQVDGG